MLLFKLFQVFLLLLLFPQLLLSSWYMILLRELNPALAKFFQNVSVFSLLLLYSFYLLKFLLHLFLLFLSNLFWKPFLLLLFLKRHANIFHVECFSGSQNLFFHALSQLFCFLFQFIKLPVLLFFLLKISQLIPSVSAWIKSFCVIGQYEPIIFFISSFVSSFRFYFSSPSKHAVLLSWALFALRTLTITCGLRWFLCFLLLKKKERWRVGMYRNWLLISSTFRFVCRIPCKGKGLMRYFCWMTRMKRVLLFCSFILILCEQIIRLTPFL